MLGQKEEAKRLFLNLNEGDSSNVVFAFEKASIYYSFDEVEKVFQWLDRAYENREFFLVSLKVDPGWDSLRSDPRFQRLMKKMNFPE